MLSKNIFFTTVITYGIFFIVFLYVITTNAKENNTTSLPINQKDISLSLQSGNINNTVEDDIAEQNLSVKDFKLSEIFANPQDVKVAVVSGILLQSLDNKSFFVFNDQSAVINMYIEPSLWTDIGESKFKLNTKLQFLVKIQLNSYDELSFLEVIKIDPNQSEDGGYEISSTLLRLQKYFSESYKEIEHQLSNR